MATYPIKSGEVSVVPVKLYGPHGKVIVHAIVDSGATFTMFPPALLASIGLLPSSENLIKIITASSIEYVPQLKLTALEFLGKKVESVDVVSHILPQGMPAQGLIGVNAFQNFRLTFDYPNELLLLE